MKSARWSWVALVVVAVAWTSPALAAEAPEVTMGKYSKTGQMFDLIKVKPVEMSADKRSVIGLLVVGSMPDTIMLCYEGMEGGILGLVGEGQIAYVEGSSLADLKKVPAAQWKETLDKTKAVDKNAWKKLREDKAQGAVPANAVTLAPNVQAVPLVDRPGNFLICQAKDKLFLVEVLSHEKEGDTAKVKIHPLP